MKNNKFLGITLEYWTIITGLFALVFLFCLSFKVIGNYSWLTVTKLGISIMGIVMTFIVFMRGFEVFEETQKGNAKDNVNKNFYAMLGHFQKIQTVIKQKKTDKGNYFEDSIYNINEILELEKNPDARIVCIANEIETVENELIQYFNFINQLLYYINSSYREGTIDKSDYRMYIRIFSSHFEPDEMTFINLYTFLSSGAELGTNLFGTGFLYDNSNDPLFMSYDKDIYKFSNMYLIFIDRETYRSKYEFLFYYSKLKEEQTKIKIIRFINFCRDIPTRY